MVSWFQSRRIMAEGHGGAGKLSTSWQPGAKEKKELETRMYSSRLHPSNHLSQASPAGAHSTMNSSIGESTDEPSPHDPITLPKLHL